MFSKIPFPLSESPAHSGQAGLLVVLAGPTVRLARDLNEIAIATYLEDPG